MVKKMVNLIAGVVIVLAGISCSNTSLPAFVRAAYAQKSGDVLMGHGRAKMASVTMARVTAETRARVSIVRQIEQMANTKLSEYSTDDRIPGEVNKALSQIAISGCTIVNEDTDKNGTYWVVVTLGKNEALETVNKILAAVKIALPEIASSIPPFDGQQ